MLPLWRRKELLASVMPRVPSRVRFVEHIDGRGVDPFRAGCRADLEGIVAKWREGTYQVGGATTSWLKIKNRDYTQAKGRSDLFAARAAGRGLRGRYVAPRLLLA